MVLANEIAKSARNNHPAILSKTTTYLFFPTTTNSFEGNNGTILPPKVKFVALKRSSWENDRSFFEHSDLFTSLKIESILSVNVLCDFKYSEL